MCTEKAYRLKIVDFDEVSERKEYMSWNRLPRTLSDAFLTARSVL